MLKTNINLSFFLIFVCIINSAWDYNQYLPISIKSWKLNSKYIVTNLSNFPGIDNDFKTHGLYESLEEVEEQIFNHLKLVEYKQEFSSVIVHRMIKDEYGNDKNVDLYLADINIHELKKYKAYKYWKRHNNFTRKSICKSSIEGILTVIKEKERSEFLNFFGYLRDAN